MKPGKKDRPQILCFLSGGTLLEREILQRGILERVDFCSNEALQGWRF